MSEDYWDGALWVYHADITNDAMDAATQSYTIVPGVGNEMELLYGTVLNGDTSARNALVEISDGANRILRIASFSLGAATNMPLPFKGADNADEVGSWTRFILAGTMQLEVSVAAVAVSQDSALGLCARIRGSLPLVTEAASAGTPVISINTEQVL